jgi:hypothetical protein
MAQFAIDKSIDQNYVIHMCRKEGFSNVGDIFMHIDGENELTRNTLHIPHAISKQNAPISQDRQPRENFPEPDRICPSPGMPPNISREGCVCALFCLCYKKISIVL